MPLGPRFTGMSKKHRYKIRNWNAYNRALINRGSLTLWIDEEAAHTQWCNHEKNGRRGRDLTSSDWAIQWVLTLKVLYRLPLRATQGLVASLLELMGLDLPTPSYTQICRRQATLTVAVPRRKAARARHIVIDAPGLKVYGEGEWKVRQHGVSKRRTSRKLRLTVDAATQEIVASVLTENDVGDCEVVEEMLGQLEADEPIEQADADGAYDTRRTYRAVSERGARVCIPPRENACPWKEQEGFEKQRNAAIEAIGAHGKARWKREVGYHRRSLAETAMFRIKTLCGERLMAREFDRQAVEAGIRVSALNTFTRLGMPESVCIG
jgi:hypothetical protein